MASIRSIDALVVVVVVGETYEILLEIKQADVECRPNHGIVVNLLKKYMQASGDNILYYIATLSETLTYTYSA